MRFIRRIAEKRDDVILARARPYLEDGEDVAHWVRARRQGSHDDGFVFLTEKRLIVYWSRRDHGHYTISWDRVTAWGINEEGTKGPILAVESPDERTEVQLKVGTEGSASRVREFLDAFGDLAPIPRRALHPSGHMGEVAEWHPNVQRERRSVAGHTRRVVVTVIGVVLLGGGVILSLPLVPGPGFLLLLAGFAVLASEYDWAQDLRDWGYDRYRQTKRRLQSRKQK